MFKKSLIALAVVASSASFAQVTVTGNLTTGFSNSNVPVGAMSLANPGTVTTTNESASGFGVDTAEITFTAKEDLGGGMKAVASMGLVDMSRGNVRGAGNVNTGFGAGNSELSLMGDFGQVRLSTGRSTDYLSSGMGGVGGTFMDGRVFNARTSTDSVSYTVPVGPVVVAATYAEANNALGLGAGSSGVNNGSRQVSLGARYGNGPVAANAVYLSNENVGDKGHYRAAASYDFGVVKVGGGFEWASYEVNTAKSTTLDMLLSASVPLGATTLSANWAQREVSQQVAGNGVVNGYGLKANYSLSKRTALIADYTTWTGAVGAERQSQYNLFASHSF